VTAFVILRSGPQDRTAARQNRQNGEVTAYQSLLLVAAPAFDLPFGGSSLFEAVEMLMEHQSYWSSKARVSAVFTGLMFGYSLVEAADCGADVIGIVGTTENVEVGAHVELRP
jgi:hypothetical protein